MRMPRTARASTMVGLLTVLAGFAEAADLRQPAPLTDAQLDMITAGVLVSADGTGSAEGQSAQTEVRLIAIARSGGNSDGAALGQVTASATSTAAPLASASSRLSLSFASP